VYYSFITKFKKTNKRKKRQPRGRDKERKNKKKSPAKKKIITQHKNMTFLINEALKGDHDYSI